MLARLTVHCSNMRKVPKSHNWYKQFGLSLHLYPFFLVQSAKALARLCECTGSPVASLLANAISTYITRTGIKNWPEPSFTSLLFSAINEGSGETAQCSLARSFAARICDIFHELFLKFLPEPLSTSLQF